MRVSLSGLGTPILLEALPDPNVSSELPPQSFIFAEDDVFLKSDFVSLGYTHFEVICIGAAGGRGPLIYKGVSSWPYYFVGLIEHWHDPIPVAQSYRSGAGGGGGIHRVVGLLADLPEESPVVVGQPGADGPLGHVINDEPFEPVPPYSSGSIYDEPHLIVYPAEDGEDGGYSSFNGDLAQASGGKAGAWPLVAIAGRTNHPMRTDYPRTAGGDGGEGGTGGQIEPGGGGAGGTTEYESPPTEANRSTYNFPTHILAENGGWDGEFGEGGGGGRGGRYYPTSYVSQTGAVDVYANTQQAGSGAKGAYSFGDNSKSGLGQGRQNEPLSANSLIIPGGGGGAKPNALEAYGSNGPVSSPQGAVFIRLTKVT